MGPVASRKRQRFDPMSGINLRPLQEARSGVGSFAAADGRQPFMPQEYLTNPAFECSLRLCLVRRETAAFRRALSTRLSSSDGPRS
jgi:hypothetical protein